jgi:hypothetical protein
LSVGAAFERRASAGAASVIVLGVVAPNLIEIATGVRPMSRDYTFIFGRECWCLRPMLYVVLEEIYATSTRGEKYQLGKRE